jgi:hypothetical protein
MAISTRNQNLFAAEDWEVAYQAFTKVSFKAYDFSTMRTAMLNYIKENYPESFNDYIESSEFVAIVELLAYLSQSLAFRADLNTRENFLATAESKDSILRLADMLGYAPKRNIPASGLIKIDSVSTDEPLLDATGESLQDTVIEWNDPTNANSFDQFITILNSAFSNSNPFTKPIKEETVGGIATQVYGFNNQIGTTPVFPTSANINGTTIPFELVSTSVVDGVFKEADPDIYSQLNISYRNDKRGLDSEFTGFFMMFKQGTLSFNDYIFERALPNRTLDLAVANINETDVFVQQLDENAVRQTTWDKVSNLSGQTLLYNNLGLNKRNVYSVDNLFDDGIRVRFSDGNFANIPSGIFRVYYRTSLGENFTVRPQNLQDVQLVLPYFNNQGQKFNLTLSMSLKTTVANGSAAETLASIKQRAPQTYFTQNRMVSAQDYNVFPLSQSVNILKLKATNRTHAGHSRYIDIEDPTGRFSSVTSFADDGALYKDIENKATYLTFGTSKTISQILKEDVANITKDTNLQNFVYDDYRKLHQEIDALAFDLTANNKDITWVTQPSKNKNNTGYFTRIENGARTTLNNSTNDNRIIQPGSYITFRDPADPTVSELATITSIANNGVPTNLLSVTEGVVKLNKEIKNAYRAVEIIPTLNSALLETDIGTAFKTRIEAKEDFGIGYNFKPGTANGTHWYIIDNTNLQASADFSPVITNGASWLMKFEYNSTTSTSSISNYTVTSRGTRLIFESLKDIKFYFSGDEKTYDSQTGRVLKDKIALTTANFKPQLIETYNWVDTNLNDIGDSWQLSSTNATYTPNVGNSPEIILRSRDVKAKDLEVRFISNYGLLVNGEAGVKNTADYGQGDFVAPVSTTIAVDPVSATTGKAVVKLNSAKLSALPSSISIPLSKFGSALTGGANGNIAYVNYDAGSSSYKSYTGNATTTTFQVGDTATEGHIDLLSATSLKISDFDSLTSRWNGFKHADQMQIVYKNVSESLDKPLEFEIVDSYRYSDGYADPAKVVVKPIDSDYDGFPDDPNLFDSFVGTTDFVFFEQYTDLDGYTYERPAKFKILNFSTETEIIVDFVLDTVAPGSDPDNKTAFTDFDMIIVKDLPVAETYLKNNLGKLNHKLVFPRSLLPKVYELINDITTPKMIVLTANNTYNVKIGRSFEQNTLQANPRKCSFEWKHIAPSDVRIDPSISNVVEMFMLTKSYYQNMISYKNGGTASLPNPPTSEQLAQEFAGLDEFKSVSDQLVYSSGKFKLLFGDDAEEELQAKIKVVKLPGSSTSDAEVRSAVLELVDAYFNVDNWDFGETFYFSELSAYIHQELGRAVASVVIVPSKSESIFGDLYQVRASSDELFFSTATVDNIEVVKSLSATNLRQTKGNAITKSTTTSSGSSSSSSSGSSGSGGSGGSGY